MKRFQSLLASFVLVFALAAYAAAGDGIIHTGSPYAPQPTPTPGTQSEDDGVVRSVVSEDEDDAAALDYVFEAALDCLQATFTLF